MPLGWQGAHLCHLLSIKPFSASHHAEPAAARRCFPAEITAAHSQPRLAAPQLLLQKKGKGRRSVHCTFVFSQFCEIITVMVFVSVIGHFSSCLQQVSVLLPMCHLTGMALFVCWAQLQVQVSKATTVGSLMWLLGWKRTINENMLCVLWDAGLKMTDCHIKVGTKYEIESQKKAVVKSSVFYSMSGDFSSIWTGTFPRTILFKEITGPSECFPFAVCHLPSILLWSER